MTRVTRGTNVSHPLYGRGTVLETRALGHECLVSFGRFSIWLRTDELRVISPGLKVVPSDGQERRPSFDELLERIRQHKSTYRVPIDAQPRFRPVREERPIEDAIAIESFRLGIVPVERVNEWTVGRDAEVQKIREFLRDEAEGAILIEGPYGSGKSHLIRYLELDALEQGYAVACAGLEPSEATAAFPNKMWAQLVNGFRVRFKDRPLDFRAFWREVALRKWRPILGNHPILSGFLERLSSGKEEESDWDWIETRGRVSRDRPTLHTYSTCANIYCNLISATGRAAVEALGLQGFLVLIDEAEVANNVLYRYQALRGINFFAGLTMMANDDHVLLEEGIVRKDVLTGELTGLVYSGHNPVRYTSGIPSHVKVAFALTPLSLQQEFARVRATMATITLDVLGQNHLRELFERICNRFESVMGLYVPPRTRSYLFNLITTVDRASNTRGFIKAAIELLDFLRFYPEENVEKVVLGVQ